MTNSLPPCDALDDYEIQHAIGSGACGTVYRARDRRNGRICAVKAFPITSGATRQLFREISVLFSVDHPNVIRCLDFLHRTESRRHYLVFEYAEGGSLRDLLHRRATLETDEALEVMHQITEGVHHAHERQIVHCDLKPENILIHRVDGRTVYKVADLGIARHLSNVEERQVSVGSPAYMAPEQFYDEASCASDLYALGVMFYEMLVGQTPFEDTSERLWIAHLKQAPDLGRINDAGCRALIGRLLSKRPEDRPRSAQALLDALDGLTARVQRPLSPPRVATPVGASESVNLTFARRREVGRANTLHVIDGCLFVSDDRGTDLYDASRDYLLPRFVRGAVTASCGRWFATDGGVHTFDAATRAVRTHFIHRTRVEAIAPDPVHGGLYYADDTRLYRSTEDGDLSWSVPCRNYFVQPQIAVLSNGLVLVTSGPVGAAVTAWRSDATIAWRVELEAPVLALAPIFTVQAPQLTSEVHALRDEDKIGFQIVTMGLSATEPTCWLRFEGPRRMERRILPQDVCDARFRAAHLVLGRSGAETRRLDITVARDGRELDSCAVEGVLLGHGWTADGHIAVLSREGRLTVVHVHALLDGSPRTETPPNERGLAEAS